MLDQIYYFITGNTLYSLLIISVFLSASLFMFWLTNTLQDFILNYKSTFTESANANMGDMFMTVDVNQLFYINMIALAVVPTLLWLLIGDPITTIVVFMLIALAPSIMYKRMRKQRLRRFEEQMPDALIMLSGAMRAGASLNIALENLVKEQPAPLSQEFELFMREQRIGVDFEVSLTNMEKRIPLQDFSMFTSALRINREIGGNLAEIIESLGDTLRKKHQMEGKIESLTAQGKMQGIVMTGLPVLLAVLLYFLEKESMEKLWTTSIGWGVLTVIIFMETMGYIMISKITRINV